MNRHIRNLLTAAGLLGAAAGAFAQPLSTPLEFRQSDTLWNFQSRRGVPISSTVNTNIGSDGRMTNYNESVPSTLLPTTNQFRGFVSFGGVPGYPYGAWQVASNNSLLNGSNAFSGPVAQAMGLPVGTSNNVVGSPQVAIILRRGQIGAPYLSRQVSFAFGDIVQVPDVNENAVLLPLGTAAAYWFAEPYTTTFHTNSGYYWSPHAGKVYASESGQVKVTWKKRSFVSSLPSDYTNTLTGATNYFKDAVGNYYRLFTASYIVSGSAVKPPRKMYWTEKSFSTLGKPVGVPSARVGAVVIAYNNNFPATVTNQYVGPGETNPGGTTNQVLQELRTLWYDQQLGTIFAYNREGRVFMELLGDPRPDGVTREPLGFEIVDVIKNPTPLDVTTELGELLPPPPPGRSDELTPEPVLQVGTPAFAYQQNVPGSSRLNLYAANETANQNDFLVHWMEEGVQALKWPSLLGRYRMIWPTEAAKFNHYVRPLVATEAEAKATAVQLPTANAPAIQYQDPLDQVRGKLTEGFAYYSFLDVAHPTHRALLRFTTGDEVAFERIFSWLDVNLKTTNFANTLATNLTSVADFVNYPKALLNYQMSLSRGVNGEWKLFVSDDLTNGVGSIASWSIVVETTNSTTGTLNNIEFANANAITINDNAPATPYPSAITVSGITGAVTTVRVKLNGLSHQFDDDVDAFLVGPRGQVCALISDAGGHVTISNLDLVLDDAATAFLPTIGGGPITNGTYRPTNYQPGESLPPGGLGVIGARLEALLLPVPIEPDRVSTPWTNELSAPRVVNQIVDVGARLSAPDEPGAPTSYLAGHVHLAAGTLFNGAAYVDPLVSGFAAANQSAIIPVNAIPGTNNLEVWWFRSHSTNSGANAANSIAGFQPIYWPSILGRYTIQWPDTTNEIVLASKLGSGTLDTFEAMGTIYAQNNPALIGYNPNEEHAIMSGGIAYATRDDLNLTSGVGYAGYSSAPFVLVACTAPDSRPMMSTFKVLREKPSAGWVFDYIVPAGQLLQAPMPLPLLAKPVEGSGDNAINYNTEPVGGNGDLPGAWLAANGSSGIYSNYAKFTYRDRHHDFWVYRGLHAGLPALQAGRFIATNQTFAPITGATGVVNSAFSLSVHASRQSEFLTLAVSNAPNWLQVSTDPNSPLTLAGTPTTNDVGMSEVQLIVRDLYDETSVTNNFTLQVVAAGGTVIGQAPLVVASTNSYTGTIFAFSNRPPFLAESPSPSNSFTMRYYYKTEPSFAWPGVANPPPIGSIVPYLRPGSAGSYAGNGSAETDPALDIVYRPVWPVRDPKDSTKPLPTIDYGLTLVKPYRGLPGVGDWKTAHVLYQQSIAANLTNGHASVVLHDPTRAKTADITNFGLQEVPAGVRTESYQGKVYFPNLPPHLGKRLFFEPARGAKGSLVLKGEFRDETVGEDFILLNVLRGSDLTSAFGLCPAGDTVNYPKWTNAIGSLATDMETFYESTNVPGTYVVKSSQTVRVGVKEMAEVSNDNLAVDSYALSATGPGSGYITLVESGGTAFTKPGDPVALHVFKVGGGLHAGELKVLPAENPLSELVSFQHTPDLAGRSGEYEYEWKIGEPVDGLPPLTDPNMSRYIALTSGTDLPRYTLGGAGIQVLSDNYLVVRYRPLTNSTHPLAGQWSEWTQPQLAEGWIKRVLAGINPFNQRTTDFFNNAANTDASILTAAGHRWEGDVALNLDTINSFGLIEIYETILRRGRSISIESGYNHGGANDALLLAAGYLSDLYMMEGNEAWADAANPTIGIGTANNTYGAIATSLFSFKGQVPTLLDEELALLRGRDDVLQPGVSVAPFYNRLIWNYTRGIDSGEVIYALNYNIQENPNLTPDGIINAADAARMFPQGHGDAYGHYLTALKGYYSLLLNPYFDWVPRIEAVLVAGVPVSVDYQDERKFAAAAAAVGRAGRQTFDLTWRKDYQPRHDTGWSHFSPTRENTQRTYTNSLTRAPVHPVRYWGLDHWASRTGQGDYLNWVVGNAILPAVDPNPAHEKGSIQKIDRTTVPELTELATMASDLQTSMDNAEGGLTPLGLPQGSVALDIDPNAVVGTGNGTHFEQIYSRTKVTLNNAVAAFDDAKNVTSLMRSEQDSLAGVQAAVAQQELAYNNALIELYGTPYTDDIGPGKTFKQGYAGPDLLHFGYAEMPQLTFPGLLTNTEPREFRIDIQNFTTGYENSDKSRFDFVRRAADPAYLENTNYISFTLDSSGSFRKPANWTGRRVSPGKLQDGIARIQLARNAALGTLSEHEALKRKLDRSLEYFSGVVAADDASNISDLAEAKVQNALAAAKFAATMAGKAFSIASENLKELVEAGKESTPKSLIIGFSTGGDLTSFVRGLLHLGYISAVAVLKNTEFAKEFLTGAFELKSESDGRLANAEEIQPALRIDRHQVAILELDSALVELQQTLYTINQRLQELDDARRNYQALVAQGDRIQLEREVARQRTSAVVQGFRTRDAAFRIFRNEKLERYKTLFDQAARYSFLAANAYDYETGLLNTTAGRSFVNRIVSARALGVVQNGEPQFAGSNTGDPGLSSALAEMKADWDVVKGRLGFNNPDAYGTTVSLRTENFRILPGTNSDVNWQNLLQQSRRRDVTEDEDVRRHCLQISRGDGLPVPGIIIEFSTTIANGYNLFGQELAAGDHAFSPSSFATKIFGVGATLEGYRGMDQPAANGNLGGITPPDPNLWFLDPLALAATPYVYLIPVGVDAMRSPPLGDASAIRTWTVDDVAVPLPFNIGASQLSSGGLYQSADSLSEPLFTVRKHQAFRPVPTASFFSTSLYGTGGTLQRSQYTNNRLIGRSAWNSRWKLVIPGHTLLNDPDEGLERFMRTVRDVKLHFVTYSYSGN